MSKRLTELNKIYENVDEKMRILVSPLLRHAEDWEKRINKYRKELNRLELSRANKERITFLSRLIREAEQQYTNVLKVLISALRRDSDDSEDDFDKFLKEMECENN